MKLVFKGLEQRDFHNHYALTITSYWLNGHQEFLPDLCIESPIQVGNKTWFSPVPSIAFLFQSV